LLHVAVGRSDIEMLTVLLECGVETDVYDKLDRTPMQIADQRSLELLIIHGATWTATPLPGSTIKDALDQAKQKRKRLMKQKENIGKEVLRLLRNPLPPVLIRLICEFTLGNFRPSDKMSTTKCLLM